MTTTHNIRIIQGGMGIAVSGWQLARSVSRKGQLGVVSGTCINVVLARRLQDGDPGGHMRRALRAFPDQEMAERAISTYFLENGRNGRPYKTVPMFGENTARAVLEINVLANFVEVWLAKEGHDGVVGINYLTKLDLPFPSGALGAMIAGVDYVLMGAGIPAQVPEILTRLSRIDDVDHRLEVDEGSDPVTSHFDPKPFVSGATSLKRPKFLAIVASNTLATFLYRDLVTRPDGFIIEAPTAGGHNAPPRGKMQLDATGQPIYGDRDAVDIAKFASYELPYWVAGGRATREAIADAVKSGAQGVQIGTAFAFCEESGLAPDVKAKVIASILAGDASVFTDPIASPSGYPFKVVQVKGTLSEEETYQLRTRICDLGFLRSTYRKDDGSVGFHCPAEPVKNYLKKGGTEAATKGRKCLCNALFADIGLGQLRPDGRTELPLVTAGDDLDAVRRFMPPGASSYSAADVIDQLLEGSDL